MYASLWTGGALLVVLVVSVLLWSGLGAVGDESGASGAKGVALVTLVCWILNSITLVVLLTIGQLSQRNAADEEKNE